MEGIVGACRCMQGVRVHVWLCRGTSTSQKDVSLEGFALANQRIMLTRSAAYTLKQKILKTPHFISWQTEVGEEGMALKSTGGKQQKMSMPVRRFRESAELLCVQLTGRALVPRRRSFTSSSAAGGGIWRGFASGETRRTSPEAKLSRANDDKHRQR